MFRVNCIKYLALEIRKEFNKSMWLTAIRSSKVKARDDIERSRVTSSWQSTYSINPRLKVKNS